MIKLTAPDGTDVRVLPAAITSMFVNDASGTYHKAAKTVLIVGGHHQAVKETIAEIHSMIGGG